MDRPRQHAFTVDALMNETAKVYNKAMKDRFELKFRQSEAEFSAAHRAYLRESLVTVKTLIAVSFALLLGLAQARVFGRSSGIFMIFIGLWLAVIGLIAVVYVMMPGRIYRKHPELAEEQKVVVKTDGVDWMAGKSHRVIPWKEISRVSIDHPKFAYLYLRYGYPQVLPKEAFSSIDDVRAFGQFAQSRILSHED